MTGVGLYCTEQYAFVLFCNHIFIDPNLQRALSQKTFNVTEKQIMEY